MEPSSVTNLLSPINSGVTSQIKTGGLLLNSLGATVGLTVEKGRTGIGTTSPQSILDITSTTKALLPPRLTTAQRDTMPFPQFGMVIINTDTKKINLYNGTTWEAVTGGNVIPDSKTIFSNSDARSGDYYCKKTTIPDDGKQGDWTNINESKICGSGKWCRGGNCSLCGVDFYSNGSSCVPVGVGNYSPDNNNNLYNCTNKPLAQTLSVGGTITYSGDYVIHTFTGIGTFTPGKGSSKVEVLVVAGGGGGGGYFNGNAGRGGGGAGGLTYNSNFSVTPDQPISVTVGEGGAGGQSSNGGNGGNSAFGGVTAIGGGGGGNYNQAGNNGGSGGGGSCCGNSGGLGTPGQGNAGGAALSPSGPISNCYLRYAGGPSYFMPGGGGGGAGSLGGNGYFRGMSGQGGIGLQYDISGISTYYAGGGGGAGSSICEFFPGGAPGGLGGGGAGAFCGSNGPSSGTPNTGGGGGGGTCGWNGSPGGSGIVIVRYSKYVPFSTTYTSSGGGENNCDWKCSAGLIRSGSTCIY